MTFGIHQLLFRSLDSFLPYYFFFSVINENVMDLQSELVNCSASSTATEGKKKQRNLHNITIMSVLNPTALN